MEYQHHYEDWIDHHQQDIAKVLESSSVYFQLLSFRRIISGMHNSVLLGLWAPMSHVWLLLEELILSLVLFWTIHSSAPVRWWWSCNQARPPSFRCLRGAANYHLLVYCHKLKHHLDLMPQSPKAFWACIGTVLYVPLSPFRYLSLHGSGKLWQDPSGFRILATKLLKLFKPDFWSKQAGSSQGL